MNDLRKVQMSQLDIVLEIDRICRNNNIKYVLIGGSLLGAIRHKGFIPWDDDLDIGMLRNDYNKFLNLCYKDELNSNYSIQNWENEKNYGLGFSKIRINKTHYVEKTSQKLKINDGIFVDIFPYDNYFDDKKKQKKMLNSIAFWDRIYIYKKGFIPLNNTLFKRLLAKAVRFVSFFMSDKFIRNKLNEITDSGEINSKYLINCYGCYKYTDVLLRESFDEIIYYEFEGYKLPIPKCYDENLKTIYGDYMTPPPMDKRYNRHGILKIDFGTYEPSNKTYKKEINSIERKRR